MTDRFITALLWVLFLVGAATIVVALFLFWQDSQKPTFELIKEEWVCSNSETRSRLIPMPVGKVTVLQPTTTNVCVEYKRIKK